MNTQPNPTIEDEQDNEHWWPRLIEKINTWWIDREPTGPALREALAIPPKRATAALLATLTSLTTAGLLLVWWLLSSLIAILTAIGSAIADASRTATQHAVHDGAEHLATFSITRTITDPVHTYLTQHTTGLPITPDLAWTAWLATTAGLFLLAMLGSRGARIGWTLTGAMTTAMVYAGTTPTGRLLAAGLTVTVWAVCSIAALNRLTPASESTYLSLLRKPTHANDIDD